MVVCTLIGTTFFQARVTKLGASLEVFMSDKPKTTDPKDPDPIAATWRNLVKVGIAAILYSMVQCAYFAFNANVDWSKHPGMSTVFDVLSQLKPALVLGAIRGGMLAVMAVIIVWLGPAAWAIVGPVLAAAMKGVIGYVGMLSRAVRSRAGSKDCPGGSDEPKS
jgi:hypothetical protein